MLISESSLRTIILETLLFEGFMDDQNTLAELYPEQKDKILSFNEKESRWIAWLTARFGRNATIKETQPFEEVIESVISFSKVFDAVATKWKSNETFRKDVETFLPDRSWKKYDITPQIIPLLTSDEMEVLKGLATREKQHFKINVSEEELESDRVGKVGSWNLWMPTTRERSCKIAQYDPVTLKPKTTWCTARMAGSNLFYHYVGQPGSETMLFYIIKDNPAGDEDWLSVGFVSGKPKLSDEDGDDNNISVDRANVGLTPERLKSILGQDYSQIMIALTKKDKSLGGVHPARKKIVDAAKSVEALRALIVGLSKDDANDLIYNVLEEPEISAEVLTILARSKNNNIANLALKNPQMPLAVLTLYVNDTDSVIRSAVARNINTPTPILKDLARDIDPKVRRAVADNINTPTPILKDLARDIDPKVRIACIMTSNVSKRVDEVDILMILATDPDQKVRSAVMHTGGATDEVLEIIKNGPYEDSSKIADALLTRRALVRKQRLNERLLHQLVMQIL